MSNNFLSMIDKIVEDHFKDISDLDKEVETTLKIQAACKEANIKIKMAIKGKEAFRDRWIRKKIERLIGFKLPKDFIIHHIDGNCTNNDLSNLYICADIYEHHKKHKEKRYNK